MPWLAALTQVGLRNVLPVNAHAVYVLPGAKGETTTGVVNICGAMSEPLANRRC